MGRKKAEDITEALTHIVTLRITETDYQHYDKLYQESNCASVGEVVRRILADKQIIIFHKDASMDKPMEQLAAIRQELKAIGQNINQITRNYNTTNFQSQRDYQLQNALKEYTKLEAKVSLLLTIISQFSKQWLRK